MKPVNIYSLLQAKSSLNEEIFNSYLQHHEIGIKDAELKDLNAFVKTIRGAGACIGDLNDFYIGYKIPQIGKEFDLLRICQSSIINIEIKSFSDPEKIRAQLLRNKYYLSFIGKQIFAITFISSTCELYRLAGNDCLEKITSDQLREIVGKYAANQVKDLDSLFNPSDYLVSPFNSTAKFLSGEYFLTHQQEEFKERILNLIRLEKNSTFTAITGRAGTGKTLLTFDIVKNLITLRKNVLIIHCGQLNYGHYVLIENGWKICPIKNYKQYDIKDFDVVVIDEAQRLYSNQLEEIVSTVNLVQCACIFSYDRIQTLAKWEEESDVAGKIDAIESIVKYKLSEKIRTNKEISGFIKLLFKNTKVTQAQNSENIQINYFDNLEDTKAYLNCLSKTEWEVLRFTPSQYSKEHHEKYFDSISTTSHKAIGQEFDSVAIVVDGFFTYDEQGDLTYSGCAYYSPVKMLFQNITRARRRVNLVVIQNQLLLNRCLSILK